MYDTIMEITVAQQQEIYEISSEKWDAVPHVSFVVNCAEVIFWKTFSSLAKKVLGSSFW